MTWQEREVFRLEVRAQAMRDASDSVRFALRTGGTAVEAANVLASFAATCEMQAKDLRLERE